jgi:hypothetical protein
MKGKYGRYNASRTKCVTAVCAECIVCINSVGILEANRSHRPEQAQVSISTNDQVKRGEVIDCVASPKSSESDRVAYIIHPAI